MLYIDSDIPTLDARRDGARSFDTDLAVLHEKAVLQEKYTALWRSTPAEMPELREPLSQRRQSDNQAATDRLVDEVEADLQAWPRHRKARGAARSLLKSRIRTYARTSLALAPAQCDLIFSDTWFDATADFARRARDFDAGLTTHDLFQALRNVWIMNLFQLFLDRELAIRPAMLGYSLLYPYTDNWLDHPDLTGAEKRGFCERLERRLKGERPEAGHRHEQAVFDLVGMIESQYDRSGFPEVYQSVLAIHHAQEDSLRQQSRSHRLGEDELLGLSIAKGASSVLADGYLVAGRLSRGEADFFYGYGIVLQLIDDLQDAQQDREAGHQTLFSVSPCLDRLTGRLCRFLEAVLEGSSRFADERYDLLKDVVRTNCTQLVVQSAAQNPRLFSRRFLDQLEPWSPVPFRYARKKRKDFLKRYRKLDRRLRREGKLGSLFEALSG